MAIEHAIASELKDDAGVSALVGTRVHLFRAHPQSTLPYIVIRMEGGQGHAGHMAGVAQLTHRRGVIVCHASTALGVIALADAVRIPLDGFHGTMGSGSYTANVRRMSLTAPLDDLYAPTDGGAEGIHKRTITFDLWLQESIT